MSDSHNILFRIQGTEAQFSAFERQCQTTELLLASTLCDRFQIERSQENLGIVAGWLASARAMGIGNHLMSGIKMELVDDQAKEPPMLPGIAAIHRERLRQIHNLGYNAKVDDAYVHGELASAAATYLEAARIQRMFGDQPDEEQRVAIAMQIEEAIEKNWPFEREWFHLAESPAENLVKAGALQAAELDRLKRISDRAHQDLDSSCGE